MADSAPRSLQSRHLRVDDVPMRWLESGEGFPVVLIHGIPTNPGLWRHVMPRVDARCLAVEMVGYGDSIPAGKNHDISVNRQADYLLAWLDALDIDRAVLVGHDLGGGVAQIAAVCAPQRCAGMVLSNAIGYDSWPIPSVKALQAVAPGLRRLPAATVYAVMATLFPRGHDQLSVARESLAVHGPPYLRYEGAAALARQVTALDVDDTLAVADQLSDLDVPSQVVWGEADQFQPVDYGERFASDLDGPLHRIPGGKHFVPEDHPQDVAQAINRVIAQA